MLYTRKTRTFKTKYGQDEFTSRIFKSKKIVLTDLTKDLEELNSKLEDNSENLNNFMDQSSKIDNLERENRRLVLDLETAK